MATIPDRRRRGKARTPMQRLRIRNNTIANALKRHSPLCIAPLGTFTADSTGVVRAKILNVGLLTRLFARVRISCNISVAPVSQISPRSIYACIRKVTFTDYNRTERISTSGFNLFLLNSVRRAQPGLDGFGLDYAAALDGHAANAGIVSTFINPVFNLAAGANQIQEVTLQIPICRNPQQGDLRGIINCNTTEGEANVQIDFNTVLYGLNNDDFMFTGGGSTVTLNNINVDLFQEYYLPQDVKVEGRWVSPLPHLDLHTVYEFLGFNRMTADIASGQDKLIPMINNRDIRGFFMSYINNGVQGGAGANGINMFKTVIGGANYYRQVPDYLQQFLQTETLGVKMPRGAFFFDFPRGLKTSQFGNAAIAVTPQGTVTNPMIEYAYESLYHIGQPLGNVPQ